MGESLRTVSPLYNRYIWCGVDSYVIMIIRSMGSLLPTPSFHWQQLGTSTWIKGYGYIKDQASPHMSTQFYNVTLWDFTRSLIYGDTVNCNHQPKKNTLEMTYISTKPPTTLPLIGAGTQHLLTHQRIVTELQSWAWNCGGLSDHLQRWGPVWPYCLTIQRRVVIISHRPNMLW